MTDSLKHKGARLLKSAKIMPERLYCEGHEHA
ncbi:hypothetical protein E2C01_016411 [Portunus trituberculatus]|uniref:Uncharacterized protein n=1 Tax=Portunus trituberculatus TaxID=210409 RepID=A0A5B7DQH1_PORTR|nr:hypothetical protein [Portunus trituberculatus]